MYFLISLALVGCGTESPTTGEMSPTDDTVDTQPNLDEDDETTEDDQDTEEETIPAFQPMAGTWTVTSGSVTLDECGFEDSVDRGEEGATMELEINASSDFLLTFDGGGESVDCSYGDDQIFACDSTEQIDETPSAYGLNATIPATLSSSGTFYSEGEMILSTFVDLECEGDDCYLVEILLGASFPCALEITSEAINDAM